MMQSPTFLTHTADMNFFDWFHIETMNLAVDFKAGLLSLTAEAIAQPFGIPGVLFFGSPAQLPRVEFSLTFMDALNLFDNRLIIHCQASSHPISSRRISSDRIPSHYHYLII